MGGVKRSVNPLLRRLADRRKELGLRQEDVAIRIRRDRSEVQKWETGVYEPCLRNLENWCRALELEITFRGAR